MGTNFFKDINNVSITGGHFSMNQSPVHNNDNRGQTGYYGPVHNTDSRRQTIHHAPVYENDNRATTIYRAPVHRTDNSGQTIYDAPVYETDNSGQTKYHAPVHRTDNKGQKIHFSDVYENDNRNQIFFGGEVRYNNNGGQNIHSDHYFPSAMNPELTRNPGPYGERDGQRDRNTGLQAPYLSRENGYRTPPPHGNGPYPAKSHTDPNPRDRPYLSPPLTPYNSATNEAHERETGGNYSRIKQTVSPLGVPPVRQNIEEPADFFAPDEEMNSPESDGDVLTGDMARLGIDESKSKKKKPAAAMNTPHSGYPHAWNNPEIPSHRESQDTSYPRRSKNPFKNPYPSPESSSRDTWGPSFDFPSPFNTTNMNSNNRNHTTIQGSYNDNSITTTNISKAGGKKRKE